MRYPGAFITSFWRLIQERHSFTKKYFELITHSCFSDVKLTTDILYQHIELGLITKRGCFEI